MATFLIGFGVYCLITVFGCLYLIELCCKYDREDLAYLVYPIWILLSIIGVGIYSI